MTRRVTRRAMLAGFVATASGLLIPDPRRAYSFLTADLWPAGGDVLNDIARGLGSPADLPSTLVMSPMQARTWARVIPGFANQLRRAGLGYLCEPSTPAPIEVQINPMTHRGAKMDLWTPARISCLDVSV